MYHPETLGNETQAGSHCTTLSHFPCWPQSGISTNVFFPPQDEFLIHNQEMPSHPSMTLGHGAHREEAVSLQL